jgi:hypothetical protein
MTASTKDRTILRELASKTALIANLPVQQETILHWKALNGLKPVRPMVMIDQIPWHEMDVDGELELQTEDPICREYETGLRRALYQWKHFPVDMVIEPVVDVFKVVRGMDFGIDSKEQQSVSDPRNSVVGHYYLDQIKNEEDIRKIRNPEVIIDQEATAKRKAYVEELFDGILNVRLQGYPVYLSPWDQLVQWRGTEDLILDLIDRPEFMHKMISRLTDAYISLLDQLEEKKLLGYGQSTIHCTGAYTDELPAGGFDPNHIRAKDIWTCGMAQIFSTVSPAMHKEFELDYVNKIYARFGLVYYGCCEPLHEKIDIIRNIPHVRKISMSPWVDAEVGAERIGVDFVFSRKPNPAYLAWDVWDPKAVTKELQDTRDRCARHGCPLEFILKDISTVRYQPQRLWEWARLAMDLVKQ